MKKRAAKFNFFKPQNIALWIMLAMVFAIGALRLFLPSPTALQTTVLKLVLSVMAASFAFLLHRKFAESESKKPTSLIVTTSMAIGTFFLMYYVFASDLLATMLGNR